jgi:hypothetical protein
MKSFDNFKWNFNQCLAELEKLENLLSEKEELRETEDILPFFKKNKHLSAYIGFYATSLNRFDKNKRPRRKQRGIATLFLTFHAPQGAGNLPVILLK